MPSAVPFLLFVLLGMLTGAFVLALLAYRDVRKLASRIAELEKHLWEPRAPERIAPIVETAPLVPPPVAPPPVLAASAPSGAAPQPAQPKRAEPLHAPAPAPLSAPASAATRVDWERWIGVRGAAVVGAIVLGIAALLFFQYSIEHGLITPSARVAIGIVVGIACMGGAQVLHGRGYALTANAVTGAGAIVLYAAFWAAHMFSIWPFFAAFAAMVLVTVACCVLAHRRSSQLIAVLGLVGGFATPLALSSGHDNPVGLFGYVLLVNLGFLFVANKRRWPAIGLVGVLGTCAIEALWIFDKMRPETFLLGLVILGVFALLFAIFASRQPASERDRWRISQAAALLLPFAFTIYFAQHIGDGAGSIGWHLYPTALLCLVLCVTASWMARSQEGPWLPLGAAAGTVAVVLVWIFSNDLETARAWELVVCAVAIAVAFHAFCEARGTVEGELASTRVMAAAVCAIGLFAGLFAAATRTERSEIWPWITGFLALSFVLARLAAIGGRPSLHLAGALGTAIGVWNWMQVNERAVHRGEPRQWLALLLALSFVFQAIALSRRDAAGRRFAWWSALAVAALSCAAVQADAGIDREPAMIALGGVALFGVAMALCATGAKSGLALGLAIALTSASMWAWIHDWARATGLLTRAELALVAAMIAIFQCWPFLRPAAWRESRSVWRAAALAAPLGFPALNTAFVALFTRKNEGLVPLALAALTAAFAWRLSRDKDATPEPGARSPKFIGWVWFSAVALGFASLAIPWQLDRGVLEVTAAVYAAVLTWLWLRSGHEPLSFIALALIVASTAVIVGLRFVYRFAPEQSALVNWLAYSLLVPAAAAIRASTWMRSRETARAMFVPGSAISGFCGIALVFTWISCAILNAFGSPPHFDWDLGHAPARDMTLSIAWAVYALLLLALGVARRRSALRWVSLGLLLLTLAKVFLFDLGTVGGLFRVASLFGLAISLISVSLLYQRFVFTKASEVEASAVSP
jgi:uncharacterized membrane protein